MLAKIYSATHVGLEGVLIEVEVDVAGRGFPTFTIVGLPNKAVDEAKDRVRTAIVNASYTMPDSRITVNLAPADIPKIGSSFDLPIAVGILAASGVLKRENVRNYVFVGELSLEGRLRKVPGIISHTILAQEQGMEGIYVPQQNADEAALIEDVAVYPVQSLGQLIRQINEAERIAPHTRVLDHEDTSTSSAFDFAHIRGQEQAKRAFEIAAVGFHNVHLKGVPGAGKTMLSRAFPSILPPLGKGEVLEVSKIYSIAQMLPDNAIMAQRPFRAPHHTTSRNGLIGGGTRPTPGEISLAHRGVLFLDEFPEFPRDVLEAMRQPLEDGIVTISRAAGSLTFPARFMLVAASNPCPCGYLGHPSRQCSCAERAIMSYRKRLSGPMLDRIDIHLFVPPVEQEKLMEHWESEPSSKVRDRVMAARERQQARFRGTQIQSNNDMPTSYMKTHISLETDAEDFLRQALKKLSLSARSSYKLLRVSRSIADLDQVDDIGHRHVAEALQYRVIEG
jgi:magnesium chelatase family protein